MPIKVFISQPMADKTEEQILKEREDIVTLVTKEYGDCQIIESYIPGKPETKNTALAKLGRSLILMSDADLIVFASGWIKARGCRIEHEAAKNYHIAFVEL